MAIIINQKNKEFIMLKEFMTVGKDILESAPDGLKDTLLSGSVTFLLISAWVELMEKDYDNSPILLGAAALCALAYYGVQKLIPESQGPKPQ
jgi:hypothetical protein